MKYWEGWYACFAFQKLLGSKSVSYYHFQQFLVSGPQAHSLSWAQGQLRGGVQAPSCKESLFEQQELPSTFTQEGMVRGRSRPVVLSPGPRPLPWPAGLTLRLKLRPAASLRTCLLITGLCPTLTCGLQFSPEPQTCLITSRLSADQGSWLNLVPATRWLAVKQRNSI